VLWVSVLIFLRFIFCDVFHFISTVNSNFNNKYDNSLNKLQYLLVLVLKPLSNQNTLHTGCNVLIGRFFYWILEMFWQRGIFYFSFYFNSKQSYGQQQIWHLIKQVTIFTRTQPLSNQNTLHTGLPFFLWVRVHKLYFESVLTTRPDPDLLKYSLSINSAFCPPQSRGNLSQNAIPIGTSLSEFWFSCRRLEWMLWIM
jgi:hypothetical protein